ncbi:MAG: HNH endonuclease signature motif containing protein [Nitrospira sp.]
MSDQCEKCKRLWGSKGKRGGTIKHYAKGLCKSCYNGHVPYRNSPQLLSDPALKERFDKNRVEQGEDDCWLWEASCNSSGYGQFMFNGKPIGAHRMSWALHHQKMPGRTDVCHSCDEPSCVNPNHLWRGTRKQNHQDMSRKGRHALQKAKRLLAKALDEDVSPKLREAIEAYLT